MLIKRGRKRNWLFKNMIHFAISKVMITSLEESFHREKKRKQRKNRREIRREIRREKRERNKKRK